MDNLYSKYSTFGGIANDPDKAQAKSLVEKAFTSPFMRD
jgi:hypothetical protein